MGSDGRPLSEYSMLFMVLIFLFLCGQEGDEDDDDDEEEEDEGPPRKKMALGKQPSPLHTRTGAGAPTGKYAGSKQGGGGGPPAGKGGKPMNGGKGGRK
jgi:hypothetical protein